MNIEERRARLETRLRGGELGWHGGVLKEHHWHDACMERPYDQLTARIQIRGINYLERPTPTNTADGMVEWIRLLQEKMGYSVVLTRWGGYKLEETWKDGEWHTGDKLVRSELSGNGPIEAVEAAVDAVCDVEFPDE